MDERSWIDRMRAEFEAADHASPLVVLAKLVARHPELAREVRALTTFEASDALIAELCAARRECRSPRSAAKVRVARERRELTDPLEWAMPLSMHAATNAASRAS